MDYQEGICTDKLEDLMNFKLNDKMTPEDFFPIFTNISDKILNGCALVAKKGSEIRLYRIIEIEFYCKHEKLHNDNFTHQSEDQLDMLEWYFHKYATNYKAGTYKGLDISFGRRDPKMYGGILIRSIQDISSTTFIEGSCNIVKHIFKFFGNEEVKGK